MLLERAVALDAGLEVCLVDSAVNSLGVVGLVAVVAVEEFVEVLCVVGAAS